VGSILTAGRPVGARRCWTNCWKPPGHDLTALAVTIGDEGVSLEPEPAAPRSAAAAKGTAVVEQLSRWAASWSSGTACERLPRLWPRCWSVCGRAAGIGRADDAGGAPGGGRPAEARPGRQAGGQGRSQPGQRAGDGAAAGALAWSRCAHSGRDHAEVLIGIAIAIPLIVALLVVITVVQRGRTRQAELNEAWQAATTNWQKVDTVSVPAAQRTYLTTALGSLDHVLELKPGITTRWSSANR